MPPITLGSALPVSAVNASTIRNSVSGNGRSEQAAIPVPAQPPSPVRSAALDPGEPPVDTDRVQIIRQAVEAGTYPLLPTRVADAIIAAGLLLRSGK